MALQFFGAGHLIEVERVSEVAVDSIETPLSLWFHWTKVQWGRWRANKHEVISHEKTRPIEAGSLAILGTGPLPVV